ncbi:MAG TPA: tetratricopeptide repeat protein, partial [Chryseolinea sp.]|nr:tetratricopeptide repeat protein [Chryseolinea sp.]
MTRLLKRLGLIIFFGIQTLQGFCQDRQSWTVFEEGNSLLTRDRKKANALITKAMNMSRDHHDWMVYARIVSGAGRFVILDKERYRAGKVARQNNELYDSVFQWTKDALSNGAVLPKDTTLAVIFYNAGEFYSSMYQVDLPVQYYKQAIKLWIPLTGELTKELADCYHGLGDVYKYNKFDFLEAEKCYEKALSIREKIHFDDTEVFYKNYYSLAATNRSQHDFEKALSYGSVALSLSRQLVTLYQEITNAMIANIYRDMRSSEMARTYYMAALKLNATTKNPENRAWYYQCLAETLENDTLYDEAIGYFLKADALYATMNKNDRRLFSTFLIRMSHTYSLKNDSGKFFETIRRVFDELRTQQRLNSMEAAESYVLIGDYYKDRKQYDSATVNYQKALHVAVPSFHSVRHQDNPTETMIGLNYYAGTILAKKAILMRELFLATNSKDYLYETLDCLTLAERLLSQERNTLDTEDAKWSFLDANYDIYDHIISSLYDGEAVLSRDSVVTQAYRYFEKSKSRSLADALFQAEHSRQISAKDTLLKSHAFLKSELFRAENKINQLMNDDPASKEINRLREEIVSLDKQAQRVKTAIESKYPGYFSVKYGYDMPLVGVIQKTVQPRNEVILEYFWGSNWVYGLAISADSVLFKRLGRPESLGRTIDQLLTHVTTEHSSTSVAVFSSFTASAADLYRILVSPFAGVIAPGQRIQIIPDGAITQIPFEILLTSSPVKKSVDYRSLEYLLKANSIGYAYSSAMLIRKNQRVVRRP